MQPTIKLNELIDNLLRISNQSKPIPLDFTVKELLDIVHLDDYGSIRMRMSSEFIKKLP